jgi:hypothetical protein
VALATVKAADQEGLVHSASVAACLARGDEALSSHIRQRMYQPEYTSLVYAGDLPTITPKYSL